MILDTVFLSEQRPIIDMHGQLQPVVNELVESAGLGNNQIIQKMNQLGYGVDSKTLRRWREGEVDGIENINTTLALACCICLTEEDIDRLLAAAGKATTFAGLRRSAVDDTRKLVDAISELIDSNQRPGGSAPGTTLSMLHSSIRGPVIVGSVEGDVNYTAGE